MDGYNKASFLWKHPASRDHIGKARGNLLTFKKRMFQVDRETFQAHLDDQEKLDRLLEGHEELDLFAYDRMQKEERDTVRMLTPTRYYFLQCEAHVERIIRELLEDNTEDFRDLRKELFAATREREQYRELMDRILLYQQQVLSVLSVEQFSLAKRGLHLAMSPATFLRKPQGGYFRSERELFLALREAQKMAYKKARDRMYLVLKRLLYEKEQREPNPQKKKHLRSKRRFLSVMHMRYRAFELSKEHHYGQFRKTGEAYVFHPDEVTNLLMYATRKKLRTIQPEPDPLSLVAEGEGHDWEEDCGLTAEDIEEIFNGEYRDIESYRRGERTLVREEANRYGQKVARVISLVSEQPDERYRRKAEREEAMIRRFEGELDPTIRHEAHLVKLADRIHNLDSLRKLEDPEAIRRKLRSTVSWCLYFDRAEEKTDTFGLTALLIHLTWISYKFCLYKNRPDILDEENLERLEAIMDRPLTLPLGGLFIRPLSRSAKLRRR